VGELIARICAGLMLACAFGLLWRLGIYDPDGENKDD